MDRMIYKEHIQVTVLIVIKERCLCIKTLCIQSIFSSFFGKGNFSSFFSPVVNEQFIFPGQAFILPYFTYVNIQPAIIIHVRHCNTRFPVSTALYAGLLCYIFKNEVAFV